MRERDAIDEAFKDAIGNAFAVLINNLIAADEKAEAKYQNAIALARQAKEIATRNTKESS